MYGFPSRARSQDPPIPVSRPIELVSSSSGLLQPSTFSLDRPRLLCKYDPSISAFEENWTGMTGSQQYFFQRGIPRQRMPSTLGNGITLHIWLKLETVSNLAPNRASCHAQMYKSIRSYSLSICWRVVVTWSRRVAGRTTPS